MTYKINSVHRGESQGLGLLLPKATEKWDDCESVFETFIRSCYSKSACHDRTRALLTLCLEPDAAKKLHDAFIGTEGADVPVTIPDEEDEDEDEEDDEEDEEDEEEDEELDEQEIDEMDKDKDGAGNDAEAAKESSSAALDWEAQRLANIARNKATLAKLDLPTLVPTKTTKARAPRTAKKVAPVKRTLRSGHVTAATSSSSTPGPESEDQATPLDVRPPPLDAPVAPLDVPMPSLDAPVAPLDAPMPSLDAPVAPLDAPVAPLDAPVPPQDVPVAPLDAPVPPQDVPAAPLDAPVASLDAPLPSQDAPVPLLDLPMAPLDAPVPSLDEYMASLGTPVAPLNVPGAPAPPLLPEPTGAETSATPPASKHISPPTPPIAGLAPPTQAAAPQDPSPTLSATPTASMTQSEVISGAGPISGTGPISGAGPISEIPSAGGAGTLPTISRDPTLPPWMTHALDCFEKLPIVNGWVELVNVWLVFERAMGFPNGKVRLMLASTLRISKTHTDIYVIQARSHWISASGRPQEVSNWINAGRHFNKLPQLASVPTFVANWKAWWLSLQPRCRVQGRVDWPPRRQKPDKNEDWNLVQRGGCNGMFVVIWCLALWISHLPVGATDPDVCSAIADVHWTYSTIISSLSSGSTSAKRSPSPKPDGRSSKRRKAAS